MSVQMRMVIATNRLLISKRLASSGMLRKNNWKQDVVYLYQFPRSPVMPNLSPFCLKVETFLRVYNIKYEVIGSFLTRNSPRGLFPFIEFNGKQISDSQVIFWTLHKYFKLEDGLSDIDRGIARTIERMVDISTNYALMQDKSVVNASSLLSRNVSGVPLPVFVTNMMAPKFSNKIKRRVDSILGKLTKEEIREVLRRDIQAIDNILGNKKFLFGDRITSADCSVFGQLAVTYFLPYRQYITDLLNDDFPRVKNYLERIRTHYFQDWKI